MSKEVLDKAGQVFIDRITEKFNQYDLNATGRTLAGIKFEATENELRITSDRPFPYTLQEGRGPYAGGPSSNGQFLQNIQEWLNARGLDISPWAIVKKINNEGTRLHRGDDPRFNKPTDVISYPAEEMIDNGIQFCIF